MDNNDFNATVEKYKQELLRMAATQTPSTIYEQSQDIEEEENLTYNDFLRENPKSGQLKIQANTAKGTIPVGDVRISVSKIFKDGRKVFFEGNTDPTGLITGIVLPAPEKGLSENPSPSEVPYATYNVLAEHPNYSTQVFPDVNIFDGVISIQIVKLIPKLLSDNQ